MKSGYRYILYLLMVAIIASGLALFFLREQATNFLSKNTGVANSVVPVKIATSSAKDALDISLLKTAKFQALKNNVINFDFDSICKTPVGQAEIIATTTEGAVATTTKILHCTLGNNTPFSSSDKIK